MKIAISTFTNGTFIRESENPYEFDLDINGALALTPNNVTRIRFLITNDSNYRPQTSPESVNTVEAFFAKYPRFWQNTNYDKSAETLTEELVTLIDRANSTHQASEGRGGGNQGRRITAERICSIPNFEKRIQNCDPTLVDEIANALENRYTFSFATKFCTYVSRALFPDTAKHEGYSIYDLVVSKALPYYAIVYTGDLGVNVRKIKGKYPKDPYSKFKDSKYKDSDDWHYESYSNLIKQIINANEEKIGYRISRENFDSLLWYYYKGEESRLNIIQKLISQNYGESVRSSFLNSENCKIEKSEWKRTEKFLSQ